MWWPLFAVPGVLGAGHPGLRGVLSPQQSALWGASNASADPTVYGLENLVPRSPRLWAALYFGNSRNNTLQLEMQIRSILGLHPWYEHVTLVTPDVDVSIRKELSARGSRIVQVDPIPMPESLVKNSGLLGSDNTLGKVWANVFTKLLIWNMTGYEQVALIDSDAFITEQMFSATVLFEACRASFCAVSSCDAACA